ncbi:transglutaminase-like cysteine peptidase [Candidatus Pacearchaeota archaeon]|nr:transglutaminase-like cysteine peptidase [Candidatus Pacearchaeota archaeon]
MIPEWQGRLSVVVFIVSLLAFAWLIQGCATDKEWRTLQTIHSESLKKFTYAEDSYLYGKSDYHAAPTEWLNENGKVGDCEDYAIWVQWKLKKIGIKSKLKRLPGHMVLVVNNKWVIDSKYEDVRLL